MLAERTTEHLSLFTQGVEADFFSDQNELLQKVKYYLEYPDLVKKIALAARKRCVASGYSNKERLRGVLKLIIRD